MRSLAWEAYKLEPTILTEMGHRVTDFPSLSPFCSCKMETTATEPPWCWATFRLRKLSRLMFCRLSPV